MASIRDDNDDYQSYNVQLADGRTLSVDATSEESARRLAREQGGNVGVLTVELNDNPDADASDDAEFVDVTPTEGNAGGGTAPLPRPTDERDVAYHQEQEADAEGPTFAPETGEPTHPENAPDTSDARPSAYDPER